MVYRYALWFVFLGLLLLESSNNRRDSFIVNHPEPADLPDLIEPAPEVIKILPKVTIQSIRRDLSQNIYLNTTETRDLEPGKMVQKDFGEFQPRNGQGIASATAPPIPPADRYTEPTVTGSPWQMNLIFDNDIFDNRDYYYTNGLRIELVAPFLERSPLRKVLPGIRDADIDQHGIAFNQSIYTPTNPDTTLILHDDHPFSAYLIAGQFRDVIHLEKKLRFRSAFNLGVIGPLSMGKQVQTTIHEIKPVGWLNQVSNDVILDYSFQVEKGLLAMPYLELNVAGNAQIGTLYNKLGTGMNFRLGSFVPFFRGPVTVQRDQLVSKKFQYWIFMDAHLELIGYDATLQGGMFASENVYVIADEDVNRLVFHSSMGIAFYYNNFGIEYHHYYQTPRFRNAYHFGWGSLKAVVTF